MLKKADYWKSRVLMILLITIIDWLHKVIFGNPENNVISVSIYILTSALFNFLTLIIYGKVLKGQIVCELQKLSFIAIILNFIGWILYTFVKVYPYYINFGINLVTFLIYLRLILVRYNDIDSGIYCYIFRGDNYRRASNYKKGA